MPNSRIAQVPMIVADMARLLVDLTTYGLSLLPAAFLFRLLWRSGSTALEILAFPAAYCGLVAGFWVTIIFIRLIFLRRITPGTYKLTEPGALRWIIAALLMHLIQRSFLRPYINDFAPMRYLFYRLLGAKIDRTFFFGEDASITDPWGIEVGRNVMIGGYTVITAHSVEGGTLILAPVKIRDNAIIGGGAMILPGAEIGQGAIVGAKALVTKGMRIPAGEIWAGVPARKIGSVDVSVQHGDTESAKTP